MDPFELNTLHRFAKHSPGLSLEQHGSCDVPAGCGGVVFRWLNPAREAYLRLLFYTRGEATIYLDGKEIHSTVFSVPVGPHVLAIQTEGTFLMAVFKNPEPNQETLFVSRDDGSWKATDQPPGGNWNQPDFTSDWEPLTQSTLDSQSWYRQEAEARGAVPLGRAGASRLWVRKAFQL